MNALQKHVKEWIDDRAKEYDSVESVIEDLQQSGCRSGMVGDLIYHHDTLAFYETHKEEINTLLYDALEITGLSCNDLFGETWDNSDPLALDTQNQNLLAWFGFEETAFTLAREEYDLDI